MTSNQGVPVFLEQTDSCTYIFEWKTVYACEAQNPNLPVTTKCDVISPSFQQFDLSPLIMTQSNWLIEAPQTDGTSYVFQINVCAALVNSSTLSGDCAKPGVGACQTKPSQAAFAQKSLGSPSAPFVSGNNTLQLEYHLVCILLPQVAQFSWLPIFQGSKCGDGTPRNATIIFVCSKKSGLVCEYISGRNLLQSPYFRVIQFSNQRLHIASMFLFGRHLQRAPFSLRSVQIARSSIQRLVCA